MAYSTIIKPSDYFNTKLYTGTGSTNAITGVGFQPDWVWIKKRNATGQHQLFDAVRGVTKKVYSDSTDAESTSATTLTAFGTDGFTVGSNSGINGSSDTIVSWNWRASGTSGSANTDGSISSTVSVNTTSGFSIVKYVGTGSNATVGHGLGVAPKIVLVKDLSASVSWRMYTEMTGNQSQLALDQTSAADSGNTTMWNSTSPTTTTFSIGTHGNVNTSSNNYIAYCFAEKQGYSKFGSYIGNGNADGPMIYTGFKPTFIMLKNASAVQDWQMYTFDMQPFNEFCTTSAGRLKPNTTDAQSTKSAFDMLSNGFKMRTNASDINASGNQIIYMAFAEEPLVANVDGGLPTTAR